MNTLGWVPTIDLEAGLKQTVAWFTKNYEELT